MKPSKFVLSAIGLPVQAAVAAAGACMRLVSEIRSTTTETAALNAQTRVLLDRATLVIDLLEAVPPPESTASAALQPPGTAAASHDHVPQSVAERRGTAKTRAGVAHAPRSQ